MNFCILIELSKKTISFLYNRSDGDGKFKPFVGDGRALPLAVYCLGNDIQIGQYAVDEALNHNPHAYVDVFQAVRTVGSYRYKSEEWPFDTLLLNAIQKYLAYFFDSVLIGVKGRLEKNIAEMPLCFMFSSDVEENERLFIKDSFAKNGYGNVAICDYDQKVVETSKFTTPYTTCVTSDGQDLFISVFETGSPKLLVSHIMHDRGKDPRVEVAIDKLWESLGYENYYLSFEREKETLSQIAEDFLSSGEMEFQDNVIFSDGRSRECFLSMMELNSRRFSDDGKIVMDVKNMLSKMNISPLETTVVLKGKAANNHYFKSVFIGEFGSIANVTDSIHSKVLTHLLKDIQKVNYSFAGVSQEVSRTKNFTNKQSDSTVQQPIDSNLKKMVMRLLRSYQNRTDFEVLAIEVNDILRQLHAEGIRSYDTDLDQILEYVKDHNVGQTKGDPSKYRREVIRLTRSYKMRADYDALQQEVNDLLNRMHAVNVHDFDIDLQKVIEYTKIHVNVQVNPKKYQGEKNRLSRGYKHRTDYGNLLKEAKDLLNRMHGDNVHDYDAEIDEVIEFAQKNLKTETASAKTKTAISKSRTATNSKDNGSSKNSTQLASNNNSASTNDAKYRRDVNILMRGYEKRADKDKLRLEVEELLKKMHEDGVFSFDEKLNKVLSFSKSAATNSGNGTAPMLSSRASKPSPSSALETPRPAVLNTNKTISITSAEDSHDRSINPIKANEEILKKSPSLKGMSLELNSMKFKVNSDGSVKVFLSKCRGDVNVPTTIKVNEQELYVTSIAQSNIFSTCNNVRSVTLPETIISLGDFALSYAAISSIDLPTRIEAVNSYAFNKCENLTELVLPDSVLQVGDHVFDGCKSLKRIQFHGTEFWNDAILGCKSLEIIRFTCASPIVKGKVDKWLQYYDKVELHVPATFAADYKKDPIWGRFKVIKSYNK